jgi:hypothetical protein
LVAQAKRKFKNLYEFLRSETVGKQKPPTGTVEGFQAVCANGPRFHRVRPTGQAQEYHRLAGGLVMRALFDPPPFMRIGAVN